jgi:ABC-type uncharacterized transport system permease subunit
VLATLVFAFYLAAALWLWISARFDASAANDSRHATRSFVGTTLACIAVILHALLLWNATLARPGFAPNLALSSAETASAVGLCIAIIAIIISILKPAFAIPNALLLLLAAVVGAATDEGTGSFVTIHHGWELNAHIILSVLAYTLITVGAALALVLTLLDRRLRRRQPLGWLSMFPSVQALESGMFQALIAGFVVLSLALFSGFFFVQNMQALHDQHLRHKAVFSVLAWLCLATLLAGRWRFGWRGRTALYWTLGTFVLLVLAYFGSKFVLESVLGRHWG